MLEASAFQALQAQAPYRGIIKPPVELVVHDLNDKGEEKITKVKRCSQCGKEVSQGGSFCPFCGNIINENVKSESRESAIYGLDDDTQKKYQTDINKKLQKQKHLEYQKENLLKKKKSLGLKIDNYSKIIQKEIPSCERNKTAPNMPVIKIENSKMDVKWYIKWFFSIQ